MVVSGEHFVLKYLPFYVKAREVDAQAYQERLSHREKRRQKGTLRRAPGEKPRASSPPACPPAKKKKRTLTKGIIIRSLVPSFSSTYTLLASVSPASASKATSSSFGRDTRDSRFGPSILEPEHLPFSIIDKPIAEKPDPSCSKPVSFALVVIEESTAERPGPSHHKLESFAIVVLDEPAIERSISPYDLTTDFGESSKNAFIRPSR